MVRKLESTTCQVAEHNNRSKEGNITIFFAPCRSAELRDSSLLSAWIKKQTNKRTKKQKQNKTNKQTKLVIHHFHKVQGNLGDHVSRGLWQVVVRAIYGLWKYYKCLLCQIACEIMLLLVNNIHEKSLGNDRTIRQMTWQFSSVFCSLIRHALLTEDNVR